MAKSRRIKSRFLHELSNTPIVQSVCTKLGVSRQTYYRWRKEDKSFADKADEALSQGEEVVTDVAISTVVRGVQNKDPMWTKYWLNNRSKKFNKHASQYEHRYQYIVLQKNLHSVHVDADIPAMQKLINDVIRAKKEYDGDI